MGNIDDNRRYNAKGKIVGQQNRRKHVTESKENINCLPDAVILHILSFLPLKALILASLVSKQWEYLVKNLLAMIPSSLNLDELEMATRVISSNTQIIQSNCIHWPCIYQLCLRYSINAANRNFSEFVNRILHLHAGCIIKKLCFSLCYDGQRNSQEKVDKWFHFALTNEVKELELNFSEGRLIGYDRLTRAYELPHKQCAPNTLGCVILNFCKLGIFSLGVFGSLQSIFLKVVKVLDFAIEDLLSKCPMLKELSLDCCIIPFNFMISKKDIMIKSVTMISCCTEQWPMCPIDISAPELLTLTVEECYLMPKTIIKAPNITDVNIVINELYSDEIQREALVKLLCHLSHCQTLSLNTWCIQVLSYGAHFLQQSAISFNNLKHLKLRVGLEKEEFPGIAYIMRNCPYMDSLTLHIHESIILQWGDMEDDFPVFFDIEVDHYWQSQTSPFPCLQYCLKEVTVHGISGRSCEIQMLRFILENAKVLKNMSLYIPQEMSGHEILQQLSTYPKASSQAIISINRFGFLPMLGP